MTIRWVARYLVVIAVACTAAACGDNTNPIGPSNEPQIANLADNFQFQASNLTRTTQTLTYTWTNTGTRANVDQSGHVTSGSATLLLRDAAGVQVYAGNLQTTGSFESAVGTAGNWQIEVRLNDTNGTVNFRVQKP